MKTYSIEKLGSDYVVKVDDQQVIKVGSRRRAAQLVVDASELLEEAPLAPTLTTAMPDGGDADVTSDHGGNDAAERGDAAPSITRDSPEVA